MQTDPIESLGLAVPLDGYTMHLRPSELAWVAAGMVELDWLPDVLPAVLAVALERLPPVDRAPLWELAVRRFGRRKPLARAAAEIGMDALHAGDLLESLARALDS
jgi:hypothetical protein